MSTGGNQKPSTRRISARAWWIIGIGLLLIALAVFVYLGYQDPRFKWTGFQRKSLFAWLQILVSASIPVAVGIGTFALNRAAKKRDDDAQQEQERREKEAQQEQREREQAIETERAEEASLQAYLDYISQLLTDPDRPLRRTHMGDNLSVVARAQTLTVLGRLEDEWRKRSVLEFLHEAGLIDRIYPVVNLQEANLRGACLRDANLQEANLRGANLREANLQYATLSGANLQKANLWAATLRKANLRGANLQEANLFKATLGGALLEKANLQGATLFEADLQEAVLFEADLQGANLGEADLRKANLQGANLQDANFTQDKIEEAIGDEDTLLPEGIDRPESWSAHTDE